MVAEEGQNTDAEHGGHEEKEQDVEFGLRALRVLDLILGRKEEQSFREGSTTNSS